PRIRAFVLDEVSKRPCNATALAARHFGISRQAVHVQVARLVDEGLLRAEGRTRACRYSAVVLAEASVRLRPAEARSGDAGRRQRVAPTLVGLPANVLEICQHVFGEVLRNAAVHSGATSIQVRVARTGGRVEMNVRDDGVGILPARARALGLDDLREVALEIV